MIRISGAGLAGLMAAHAWPQASIFEAAAEPRAEHRALLRFRSNAVAQLTGIEFTPVTVRKGIWTAVGGYVLPTIQLANLYSLKVLGEIQPERSIWNLEPVQRWIAPENFYEQLVSAVGARIQWGTPCDYRRADRAPIISTAPLPAVLNALNEEVNVSLKRSAIHVERYRVLHCEAYQTVYYPELDTPVYRASITKDLLIIEGMAPSSKEDLAMVLRSFGLGESAAEWIGAVSQQYGKIVPLAADIRRALLFKLTAEHGIFSLGRFATWRNVLLDDVVQDIAAIRRLLRSTRYEQFLFSST